MGTDLELLDLGRHSLLARGSSPDPRDLRVEVRCAACSETPLPPDRPPGAGRREGRRQRRSGRPAHGEPAAVVLPGAPLVPRSARAGHRDVQHPRSVLCRPAGRPALAASLQESSAATRRCGRRSGRGGRPVQRIACPGPGALPIVDLTAAVEVAQRLSAEESRRSFDLERGPLWRATLLRLAEEEHLLLLTLHHIVSDGWSMGVFVRELSPSTPACRPCRSCRASTLRGRLAARAARQRRPGGTERLLENASSPTSRPLQLPTDRPHMPAAQLPGSEPGLPPFRRAQKRARGGGPPGAGHPVHAPARRFQRSCRAARIRRTWPSARRSPTATARDRGPDRLFVNTLVLRTRPGRRSGPPRAPAAVREGHPGRYAHQIFLSRRCGGAGAGRDLGPRP